MENSKHQMIGRDMKDALLKSIREYPVTTIFGPRQSGKTTLAKVCCPNFDYVTLEDKETREFATADYKSFFTMHKPPLIIDEIQRLPELAESVQVMVDSNRTKCGQFVLTGSQQPMLAEAIGESLAGRTNILELLPVSISELGESAKAMTADELMLRGFMPELYRTDNNPTEYYRAYFRTYVERDVRRLVNVKNLMLFERFMTLLAGRVGQIVNLSAMAGEVGVSSATLANWLAAMEASFLVFRLTPFHTNVSKRVVKSPKIYFTDVGLATYLLGIDDADRLARDPLRGNLFENMVVSDVRKSFTNMGRDPRISFFRTEKGFEVDLLVGVGSGLRPVEVKSARTFNRTFVKNLEACPKLDEKMASPLLVYDGEPVDSFGPSKTQIVNFRSLGRNLMD